MIRRRRRAEGTAPAPGAATARPRSRPAVYGSGIQTPPAGAVEGDQALTRLTTAAVLLVAAIAAAVSFMHIEHLAVTHGQPVVSACLLPLSIDGTVVAASMTMLRAARAGRPVPRLARFMLGLSVAATLGANVLYGVPFGPVGAVLSGWPAVAFIGSAEMAIGAVRKISGRTSPAPAPGAATARPRSRARRTAPAGARRSATDTEAAVLSALASDPGMSTGQLATVIGRSDRTARRYRERLATTQEATS